MKTIFLTYDPVDRSFHIRSLSFAEFSLAPAKVVVDPRPVQPKRESEQQFFDRNAVQQPCVQCAKVPYRRNIPGRQPFEPEHESAVQPEEKKPTDEALSS